MSADAAHDLASRIPDARLVVLQGDLSEILGHAEATSEQFSGAGAAPVKQEIPPAPGAFRTILFTDIEGSTALTQRMGDTGAQDVLRAHNGIVRDALKARGGTEIKHTGDGIMASFPSASRALECVVGIQRAVAQGESAFRVRIGLHAGEAVKEADDFYGSAVNLVARIGRQAGSGGILASDVVRQLVAGKGFLFADTGEVALKGFKEPVRLYEVRWRNDASAPGVPEG